MKTTLAIAVALLFAGCSKCGPQASTPASGSPAAPALSAPKPRVQQQTDLHSVLLLVFPEYRGTQVKQGRATLTRTVRAAANEPTEAVMSKALTANKFTKQGEVWHRPPYEVSVAGDTIRTSVQMSPEAVASVFGAPNAMSSADMAMWLPRDGALVTERERFDFDLEYEGLKAGRGAALTAQLTQLLVGNDQWRITKGSADAGTESSFDATFEQASTNATIAVHRRDEQVSLHYALVTDAP